MHILFVTAPCLPCQWVVKCNFLVTTNRNGSNVIVFSQLVFSMTDNLILCWVGSDFDIFYHFDIQLFAPCVLCQVPDCRASWQFWYRKSQIHWHVVLSKSFQIMFRQRVVKPKVVVTLSSTFQVLRWKHCQAIWTERKSENSPLRKYPTLSTGL